MPLSADRVAAAIASRLDVVVPRPLRVRAEGATVGIVWPDGVWRGGSAASELLDDGEGPGSENEELERLILAAERILEAVQDQVSEALTEPWPRDVEGQMARTALTCGGGVLALWFEGATKLGREGVVLAMPTIPLQECEA